MSGLWDDYLIVAGDFKNVERDGRVTGFQIGVRVPYYRGVYLSLFEGIELVVDGERFAPERVSVTLGDKTYRLTQLPDEPDDRWEFGQVGILTVEKPGGLAPGEHLVELKISLNIYYMRMSNMAGIKVDNTNWGIVSGGKTALVPLNG
jgi:hypothetical protein